MNAVVFNLQSVFGDHGDGDKFLPILNSVDQRYLNLSPDALARCDQALPGV